MINISVQDLDYIVLQNRDTPLVVLKDLAFDIQKGEFVVILGESGCGKSTILQMLSGLIQPTRGQVLLNGCRIKKQDPAVSLLFQGSTLLPWLSVTDNIQFGCRIRKDRENLTERVAHYLNMMNLEQYRDFYPQQLSVGQSKRVDLARSLIGNPKALLLDEPFAPLDFYTKKKLLSELLSIWEKMQITCVYVTHDIEEALLLGQKILIMENDPGTVAHQMSVSLPYPRQVTTDGFIQMKRKLLNQFGLTFN